MTLPFLAFADNWKEGRSLTETIAKEWEGNTPFLAWSSWYSATRGTSVDLFSVFDITSQEMTGDRKMIQFNFHMTPCDKEFIEWILGRSLMHRGMLVGGGNFPIKGSHKFLLDIPLYGDMDDTEACLRAVKLGCYYEKL